MHIYGILSALATCLPGPGGCIKRKFPSAGSSSRGKEKNGAHILHSGFSRIVLRVCFLPGRTQSTERNGSVDAMLEPVETLQASTPAFHTPRDVVGSQADTRLSKCLQAPKRKQGNLFSRKYVHHLREAAFPEEVGGVPRISSKVHG